MAVEFKQVELNTVELEHNPELRRYMRDMQITYKIVDPMGPAGWPVIQYQGTRFALEIMIKRFWQDTDLFDCIHD